MVKSEGATKIRRISTKTVCGTPDIEEIISKKKIELMDIFGIAGRTKIITSDFGDSIRFIGQFKAINLKTGEVFESSAMYLPKSLEEELSAAMMNAAQAEFAIRLSVNFDKSTATKYYYDAVDLIKPQNSDAMKALEARVAEQRKLLGAPKK